MKTFTINRLFCIMKNKGEVFPMKFLKIFFISNATVIASLFFLPIYLMNGDVSLIEDMIKSISE